MASEELTNSYTVCSRDVTTTEKAEKRRVGRLKITDCKRQTDAKADMLRAQTTGRGTDSRQPHRQVVIFNW